MQKIINGKRYNTETAELVATYDNGLSLSDFGKCCEDLYRTKAGRWFLHGSGGALSPWSVSIGNNGRGRGEGIEPMSEAEALVWCEDRDIDADTIAQHFKIEDA
jgi:hypothetical protein